MSNVPDGATLSDDGYYWWDGTDWQPVDGGPSGGSAQTVVASGPGDDEEINVRVEGSLGEEMVEVGMDEMLAAGFSVDENVA
ncbi:MAG TPA: hypothetical protein VFV67_29455 [Actinophytocola sp.]|uniref:hypothetical protein n=1 Tax=Actinophytocola sp. TaxID=1872138 RepID=UPI002DBD5392|nr:hypothetical protein [Actinophytocola sp.]HEU5474790.1 hypothetical protein [Actinophytocola sp.]